MRHLATAAQVVVMIAAPDVSRVIGTRIEGTIWVRDLRIYR